VGGKASLMASFGIASLSAITLLCIDSTYHSLVPFFIFGSRLGVAAACNVLTIVNITVFPSDFRSTSFGICNIFARFAAIIAPLVAEMHYPTPYLCLVSMTLFCTILSAFLMEKDTDEEQAIRQRLIDKYQRKKNEIKLIQKMGGLDTIKGCEEVRMTRDRSGSLPLFFASASALSLV